MAVSTDKEKKRSFAQQIKKRFSRSKKRSLSADRATSSMREGSNYLRPPDQGFGPQSKGSVNISLIYKTAYDGLNFRALKMLSVLVILYLQSFHLTHNLLRFFKMVTKMLGKISTQLAHT